MPSPSPAAFSSCDFPVFISPFFFSAPSLASLFMFLSLPACYAGFLLTLSLCSFVSQSLFHSHCVSLLIFLSSSFFTGLSICPVLPSWAQLFPYLTATQKPLAQGGQSDFKEEWEREKRL